MFFKKKRRPKIRYNDRYLSKAELITTIFQEAALLDKAEREMYIEIMCKNFEISMPMTKADEKKYGLIVAVIFMIALLLIAFLVPNPTPSQEKTFRIFLALCGGAFGAFIPGMLNVDLSSTSRVAKVSIRAAGAAAVFVIIYFFDPSQGLK